MKALALFAVLLAGLPAMGGSEWVTRTLRCEVKEWGPEPDVVRVNVAGICGPSCGESVRFVMFLEPRIVWDRGLDRESWLVVLRDVPMYVEAEIRNARHEVIARVGERFIYGKDGIVHRLESHQ